MDIYKFDPIRRGQIFWKLKIAKQNDNLTTRQCNSGVWIQLLDINPN